MVSLCVLYKDVCLGIVPGMNQDQHYQNEVETKTNIKIHITSNNMSHHITENVNIPATYPTAARLNFRPPPPSMDLDILDHLCREVDHLDRTSRTKHLFATWAIDDPSNQGILMLLLNELHDRLRARSSALLVLAKARTALDLMTLDLSPETFASSVLGVEIVDGGPDMVPEGRAQGAVWEREGRAVGERIARYEGESAELRRRIARVAAVVGEPRVLDEAIRIDGCKFTLFGRRHGAGREENERKFEYDGPVPGTVEEVKRGLVETAEWFLELNGAHERTKAMESGEMKEQIQLEMETGKE